MTVIGALTIDVPVAYRRRGYNVQMRGSQDDSDGFNQLREMFAKAEFGTAIHDVPGERPFGEDLTDDQRLTQFCVFTHGTSGKVQDGYYLLRPGHSFVEDHTPEGHHYVWGIVLFFLGTISYYTHAFRAKGIDEVTNDWGYNMANILHDLTVDGDLVFYEQKDQDPTDGGLWLLLAYTTEAYFVNGVLSLGTEAATFSWVNQLMELFRMMRDHEERLVYMQHDTYANAWVYMDQPFIKKFTGQNEALTRVYLLIFGTTTDYSWAFQITDIDEVTNDWGI